jgi:hypothetical protein
MEDLRMGEARYENEHAADDRSQDRCLYRLDARVGERRALIADRRCIPISRHGKSP